MTIFYPDGLPRGLYSGRTFQIVNPLQRSELSSGRARQRRRFVSVPEGITVSWLFNDIQGQAFEAWFRDALTDGAAWFSCPVDHPLGYDLYTCRFTTIYKGPVRVGPQLWSYSAQLELQNRAVLPVGFGESPETILESDIFDIAMNIKWPQYYAVTQPLLTESLTTLTTESGEVISV